MDTSKLSIIIVNWNTGKLLGKCLESLARIPDSERQLIGEVVVVDNASSDKSLVQAEVVVGKSLNRPRVRFIRSQKNLGFAAANNLGFTKIKGSGHVGHILLLNPDTEVQPGALENLLKVLEENKKAGIVGPKLLNYDGSLQPSVRAFPTMKALITIMMKLQYIWKSSAPWKNYMQINFDYQKAQPVDQVMGAAFLVRREVWGELKGLDEDYWVWFEEVDFCRRAKDKGWLTWYTPLAAVKHHGGASLHQLVGWRKTWPWIKSSLVYSRKHLGPMSTLALVLISPLTILLSIPAASFHRAAKGRIKTGT